MTFKEFSDWCNERWRDGCWGMTEAIICVDVGTAIQKLPFWKREKEWQKQNTVYGIVDRIVTPTNRMLAELQKRRDKSGMQIHH